MATNRKTLGSGLTFLAVATIYGATALRTLPLGTPGNMGPGFFPALLCGALLVLGSVLVVRSFFEQRQAAFDQVAWRALLVVSLSVLFFGSFIREVGLALAVFVTASGCSLAAPGTRPLQAVAIGLVLSLLCVGIFIYGVRLPLPVFGSWLVR